MKNKKKIIGFKILNNEDIDYYLQIKHIYSIGKNAITIKNKQLLTLYLNIANNSLLQLPINVKTYSLQGEYLGIPKDFSLNEIHDGKIPAKEDLNLFLDNL